VPKQSKRVQRPKGTWQKKLTVKVDCDIARIFRTLALFILLLLILRAGDSRTDLTQMEAALRSTLTVALV
jgi:hypothetical protein